MEGVVEVGQEEVKKGTTPKELTQETVLHVQMRSLER
jgi:hypothetical protein